MLSVEQVLNAKLTKGNTENWRSVTTVNYEVQGLGDNHNLSFLLGNEVIKNTLLIDF